MTTKADPEIGDLQDLDEQFEKEIPCEHSAHARTAPDDQPATWIVFLGPKKCCGRTPSSIYVCQHCFARVYCRSKRLRCLFCKTEAPATEFFWSARRIK